MPPHSAEMAHQQRMQAYHQQQQYEMQQAQRQVAQQQAAQQQAAQQQAAQQRPGEFMAFLLGRLDVEFIESPKPQAC